MPITPELMEQCRQCFAQGQSPDAVIEYLRRAGLSKMESLKVFVDIGRATPTEAKRLIHLSPVWKDAFKQDEELHEKLTQHAKDEARAKRPE